MNLIRVFRTCRWQDAIVRSLPSIRYLSQGFLGYNTRHPLRKPKAKKETKMIHGILRKKYVTRSQEERDRSEKTT